MIFNRLICLVSMVLLITACRTKHFNHEEKDIKKLKEELLLVHEAFITAHLEEDVSQFTDHISREYIVISNTDILRPSKQVIRHQFEEYFSNTDFDKYEDLEAPIVGVSNDGSVGWVIAKVIVNGRQTKSERNIPFSFTSTWLSLFRMESGHWNLICNISNTLDKNNS